MKAITLILILQFLITANCYSSKDRADISLDTLQNLSTKTSDLIFLGKLIRTDTINATMVFSILESFKGNFAQDTVEIKWEKHTHVYSLDYCIWLVYANKSNDSTFILNRNGLSRSIDHPEYLWLYRIPPPLPLNPDASSIININMEWTNYRLNALKDWYVELEMLREFRKKNIASTENSNFAFKTYFYVSISLNLICIALIVFMFLRLKKSLPLTNAIANAGLRAR